MSLSVIPLTILGQITGVSGSGDTVLYQVSFKSIDGTPLYGVTAVWTDEQAEIEALAAQKPYGVWINPISGTFTVKFAGYTYTGTADLDNPDVLAGITPIEFNNEAAGGGGSGDFDYCTVTVQLTVSGADRVSIPFISDEEEYEGMYSDISLTDSTPHTLKVPLYKGFAIGRYVGSHKVSTSGNVTFYASAGGIEITGDGTITISGD